MVPPPTRAARDTANVVTALPTTPPFRLDGRRALVTGGSGGIGQACCVALAEAGASVTAVARHADRLHAVCATFTAAGLDVTGVAVDVTDPDDRQAFFQDHGPFEIAVVAAGMARHRPLLETTEDDFDPVIDLNVRAAYFTARDAARGMGERGGSIIQISSQMGFVGGPERTVYCASKHAVEGMTKAMAIELGCRGIRVNTIGPTFIETELTRATLNDPDKKAWVLDKIALGRLATPTDVMGSVVFLASDASSMITGAHMLIDGGWTAG